MENLVKPTENKTSRNYDHIPGWGIDADPQNNPTYPMKHWTGDDHNRLNYEKPPQQDKDMEVLKSIERPGITAVFGTAVPPSGLSGMIRRFAFRYSESTYSHWVPLILADRINVIEGYIHDIAHGTFPNIIKERGWTAEWKYNREGVIKKLVVGATIAAAALIILSRKRARS
jgi:hypothetical protein